MPSDLDVLFDRPIKSGQVSIDAGFRRLPFMMVDAIAMRTKIFAQDGVHRLRLTSPYKITNTTQQYEGASKQNS